MIIDINCRIDRENADYTPLLEVEKIFEDDLERKVRNFGEALAFVSCIDCLECKNKCKLFEMVKDDLDSLYRDNNQLFYKYLALMFESMANGEALIVKN